MGFEQSESLNRTGPMPRRVLIVDDDVDFGESLVDLLAPHGYEVVVVADPEHAELRSAEFDPQVALLDIRLGGLRGTSLITALRARQPHLVCVMITAYAELDTAVEALHAGAYDYLRKPLDGRTLMAVLDRAFERIELERENRHALAALRESEERYRDVVETSIELIFRCNRAGELTFVNGAWERTLGEPVGALLGRPLTSFSNAATEAADRAAIATVLGGKLLEGHETQFRAPADGTVYLRVNASPVLNAAGEVIGLQGVAHDVTHERQGEQQRQRLEAQLLQAQKMEAVGQLAGGVAHDFNNLLTAIFGNVELVRADLERQAPGLERVFAGLEQIDQAAQRAAALTRQLLAFSRRQVIQPQILDLDRVLYDMEKMVRRLIGENVRLRLVRGATASRVRADAGLIEQVVMNLVVNARDAMPEGGELTISTSEEQLSSEQVATEPRATPGRYVRLRVTDTGRGMDDATLAHVFEPFFTTKAAGKGTGLGLSTVYGIVQQAGGFVHVHSVVQHGTTFDVFLPTCEAAAADQPLGKAPVAPQGGDETILLCEDDDEVRSLARRALIAAGYRVLPAATTARAVSLAETHPGDIHLLLTDVVLPDRDGKQLSEAMLRLRPGTPVLFMSGYTADVVAEHGVLEDGVELLSKPFTTSELLARVRALLDVHHGEARGSDGVLG